MKTIPLVFLGLDPFLVEQCRAAAQLDHARAAAAILGPCRADASGRPFVIEIKSTPPDRCFIEKLFPSFLHDSTSNRATQISRLAALSFSGAAPSMRERRRRFQAYLAALRGREAAFAPRCRKSGIGPLWKPRTGSRAREQRTRKAL